VSRVPRRQSQHLLTRPPSQKPEGQCVYPARMEKVDQADFFRSPCSALTQFAHAPESLLSQFTANLLISASREIRRPSVGASTSVSFSLFGHFNSLCRRVASGCGWRQPLCTPPYVPASLTPFKSCGRVRGKIPPRNVIGLLFNIFPPSLDTTPIEFQLSFFLT